MFSSVISVGRSWSWGALWVLLWHHHLPPRHATGHNPDTHAHTHTNPLRSLRGPIPMLDLLTQRRASHGGHHARRSMLLRRR